MSDPLLRNLRDPGSGTDATLLRVCWQAADEIEALRAEVDRLNALADEFASALKAAHMGLRYAVRVWVLSDEIAWSEEEIDEVVESIISDAKREAGSEAYERDPSRGPTGRERAGRA